MIPFSIPNPLLKVLSLISADLQAVLALCLPLPLRCFWHPLIASRVFHWHHSKTWGRSRTSRLEGEVVVEDSREGERGVIYLFAWKAGSVLHGAGCDASRAEPDRVPQDTGRGKAVLGAHCPWGKSRTSSGPGPQGTGWSLVPVGPCFRLFPAQIPSCEFQGLSLGAPGRFHQQLPWQELIPISASLELIPLGGSCSMFF